MESFSSPHFSVSPTCLSLIPALLVEPGKKIYIYIISFAGSDTEQPKDDETRVRIITKQMILGNKNPKVSHFIIQEAKVQGGTGTWTF